MRVNVQDLDPVVHTLPLVRFPPCTEFQAQCCRGDRGTSRGSVLTWAVVSMRFHTSCALDPARRARKTCEWQSNARDGQNMHGTTPSRAEYQKHRVRFACFPLDPTPEKC